MQARVVVIGSSNTDLSVRVPVLPEPGQTRLGRDFNRAPGGKGANQAVAARRAGAQVAFIAAVGNDPEGASAIEGYREEGIDTRHIKVVPDIASGIALIVVDDKGRNLIAVAPGANEKLEPDDILALPDNLFNRETILLISLEIPPLSAFAAATRANLSRSIVVVNAAPPIIDTIMLSILKRTDILIVNDDEAAEICRLIPGDPASASPSSMESARYVSPKIRASRSAASALLTLGPSTVIVTLSDEGCLFAEKDQPIEQIPAYHLEVVDSVGAGDSFCGAFVASLAEGLDPRAATLRASAAAAISVTRSGARSSPSSAQIADFLASKEQEDLDH